MKQRTLSEWWPLLMGAMLLFTAPPAGAGEKFYPKVDVFAQALHAVQNGYVEPIEAEKIIYGAIRGMMKVLDPHSSFMTPKELKAMQEDTEGHFGGIGIELEKREGWLVVVSPVDDTPAQRAGIKAGDRLVKIDGTPTENMDVSQASQMVRGVPGTKVVLTIDREGFDQPQDFVLIRERIRLNPIQAFMPLPGYGVVRIRAFMERTDANLMKALADLRKQAGGQLRGLVLDLRNNPGGLLEQAVRVADVFLPEGVIVETRGREKEGEKSMAHKKGTEPRYPMVCLVNGGSASAAEIVAGALQDHGRAVIMGTRTFGKGSVQKIIELKDGSGIKLTIARYYTPARRSIQEEGIVPDVQVAERPPEEEAAGHLTREIDLSGHLKKEGSSQPEQKLLEAIEDYQLKTALSTLKVWERFGSGAVSSR